MPQQTVIVSCSRCGAKLQVAEDMRHGKCPKCHQTVAFVPNRPTPIRPASQAIPPTTAPTATTAGGATGQEGGFNRYLTHYYAATHGLGISSLAITMGLVAMPVLRGLIPNRFMRRLP